MSELKDELREYLAELGRKGGLSRSEKKRAAARRNLAKGRRLVRAILSSSPVYRRRARDRRASFTLGADSKGGSVPEKTNLSR